MLFEWDAWKAEENLRKHGISFLVAQEVFNDPNALSRPDLFPAEKRWQSIGQVTDMPLLLVVFATRYDGEVEVIRIISARCAEPREVRLYVEQDYSF